MMRKIKIIKFILLFFFFTILVAKNVYAVAISVNPPVFNQLTLNTATVTAAELDPNELYGLSVYDDKGNHIKTVPALIPDNSGRLTKQMENLFSPSLPSGLYKVLLINRGKDISSAVFEFIQGSSPVPSGLPLSLHSPCKSITDSVLRQTCDDCFKKGDVWTALGCVPTDPSSFVEKLLKWAIGIAGGIAFLLILYGGFKILTSAGDPEKLNEGKDIIVSAIAGVLMIVFSVLLLKIIGVDILKIPGLK